MNQFEKQHISYLNENKQIFLERYTKNVNSSDEKIAIFTAGMSGVGKTEFSIFIKEKYQNFLHIDTDYIREFFKPIGYDGTNSDLFQKAASRGFDELFNYAMKNNYSLILDSNFANTSIAIQNIERLLKRDYNIHIFYLYNEPEVCFEYAVRREVVTHRKVPKEVFIKNNIGSYRTVLEIKETFDSKIHLHFFDKRDNSIKQDVDENYIKNEIGKYFETR